MKKVMLVATPYMGIYKDIKAGLEKLGFDVDFVSQKSFQDNPYNRNKCKKKPTSDRIDKFQNKLLDYWKGILDNRADEDLFYDYLLVFDGLTIHPYLFKRLKEKNPQIKTCNYVYDRVKGVYQIDHNFKYFDKVYSFDHSDVDEYKLNYLPIYWVPEKDEKNIKWDIFAFGGIDLIRISVFKRIRAIAEKEKFRAFIKVFYPQANTNVLIYTIRRIGKYLLWGQKSPTLKDLKSGLFTDESMSTEEFRKYIYQSNVIIDTNHPYQVGMTARFMWSLGAGKKIISNNKHIANHTFYSKEQILIIDDKTPDDVITDFIRQEREIPESVRSIINQYRIDNWLKTVLGLDKE